jgi:Raf kinase inhibitor-like YbhB/YbcL family protein
VLRSLAMTALLAALASCGEAEGPAGPPIPQDLDEFELTSPAFEEGGSIPEEFSCDGADISPPLEWAGVPEGTVELLLTTTDPDAPNGVFTHWTVYAIDPAAGSFPEDGVPQGALQGLNDFRQPGYRGPCPPPGPAHRYVFTLAALDEPSGLEAGASPEAVDAVLQKAFATTTLTGMYPG